MACLLDLLDMKWFLEKNYKTKKEKLKAVKENGRFIKYIETHQKK